MKENKTEKEVKEVSETLNISLPFGSIPLPMKIIAFLTSVGGLSMVASVFSDIVRPQTLPFGFHILRVVTGTLMIGVGYGIIKRREWSMWLYGSISVISFFINPALSILPIIITLYLSTKRDYFNNGTPIEVWTEFKKWFSVYRKKTVENIKEKVEHNHTNKKEEQ